MRNNETIILYHGSKSGIQGKISPVSRSRCDFGKGFYMGTERMQPLTLICNYSKAKIYTLSLDLSHLKILNLEAGMEWAMFVAYNRGKMESAKSSPIYEKYKNMAVGCDMVIGDIANDRMFVVLDRFFQGDITDKALVHSLSALKLGKQYAALTQKACDAIRILEEQELREKERGRLKETNETNRRKGIALADEICRKYRREGSYFDELLQMEGK